MSPEKGETSTVRAEGVPSVAAAEVKAMAACARELEPLSLRSRKRVLDWCQSHLRDEGMDDGVLIEHMAQFLAKVKIEVNSALDGCEQCHGKEPRCGRCQRLLDVAMWRNQGKKP